MAGRAPRSTGQEFPPRFTPRWWPAWAQVPARRWPWQRWRWAVWDVHHNEWAAEGWAWSQDRAARQARQAADNLAWAQRLFDTVGHRLRDDRGGAR